MSNYQSQSLYRRAAQSRSSRTPQSSAPAFQAYDAQPTAGPTWTSLDKRPIQRKEATGLPKTTPPSLTPSALASDTPSPDNKKAAEPRTTGLPNHIKSGVENLSGISLDHVKVHYNSPKPAQLNAHAYAQGSEIHVAPGQERHIGHEAWHVVQQAQGRVQPTTQFKGGPELNDDQALEDEADAVGAKLDESDNRSDDAASHDDDDDQSQ